MNSFRRKRAMQVKEKDLNTESDEYEAKYIEVFKAKFCLYGKQRLVVHIVSNFEQYYWIQTHSMNSVVVIVVLNWMKEVSSCISEFSLNTLQPCNNRSLWAEQRGERRETENERVSDWVRKKERERAKEKGRKSEQWVYEWVRERESEWARDKEKARTNDRKKKDGSRERVINKQISLQLWTWNVWKWLNLCVSQELSFQLIQFINISFPVNKEQTKKKISKFEKWNWKHFQSNAACGNEIRMKLFKFSIYDDTLSEVLSACDSAYCIFWRKKSKKQSINRLNFVHHKNENLIPNFAFMCNNLQFNLQTELKILIRQMRL